MTCELGDTHVPRTTGGVRPRADSPYVAQYIKTEELEKDCTICTRPLALKPRSLGCGHTFCKACVEALLIHDNEQLPLGRDAADVFCPTCTRGSSVKWIIDSSELSGEEEFYNMMTIRYDVSRKMAVQKYRQLVRSHFQHWRDINDHPDREVEWEFDEDTPYATNSYYQRCRSSCNDDQQYTAGDIGGFNHVTGGSIECIVLEVQPPIQTLVSGSMDDQSSGIATETDGKQGRAHTKLELVQSGIRKLPRKDPIPGEGNSAKEHENVTEERRRYASKEMSETSPLNEREVHQNKGVAVMLREMDYYGLQDKGNREDLSRDLLRGGSHCVPMASGTTFSSHSRGKSKVEPAVKERVTSLLYDIDQFEGVDEDPAGRGDDDNKLAAWCAHMSLIAVLLVVSVVIVITTIIRKRA